MRPIDRESEGMAELEQALDRIDDELYGLQASLHTTSDVSIYGCPNAPSGELHLPDNRGLCVYCDQDVGYGQEEEP